MTMTAPLPPNLLIRSDTFPLCHTPDSYFIADTSSVEICIASLLNSFSYAEEIKQI
jgi:hypothetical protein